jgi:pimeloyl-ACP methyl ester carboxylesterase
LILQERRNEVSGILSSNTREQTQTVEAQLHDGSTIEVEIHGEGPALLLPANPRPVEGPMAEAMRQYGNDPALGPHLIEGLKDLFRVIAFDYEGQVMRIPKPHTLTPDNLAADLLAVADAAGASRFAYYGYSWLALGGLQLAIRTDRLSALVMGGYPPVNGPYAEMLKVTSVAHAQSGGGQDSTVVEDDEWSTAWMSKAQTQQFVTLYEALQGFDELAAQQQITCPRLCFVGSADEIEYDQKWGGVLVDIAGPVIRGRAQLEALGWEVRVLEGLDHTQAMQADQVVPILRSWRPKG